MVGAMNEDFRLVNNTIFTRSSVVGKALGLKNIGPYTRAIESKHKEKVKVKSKSVTFLSLESIKELKNKLNIPRGILSDKIESLLESIEERIKLIDNETSTVSKTIGEVVEVDVWKNEVEFIIEKQEKIITNLVKTQVRQKREIAELRLQVAHLIKRRKK